MFNTVYVQYVYAECLKPPPYSTIDELLPDSALSPYEDFI